MRLVEPTGLQVTVPAKPKRTNRGAWRDRPVNVPPWLLEHARELSYGAIILYALLGSYERRRRPPTQRHLAERMGCSERELRRLLGELKALTLVHAERVGRSHRYVRTRHLWGYGV